jgi:iron(III) transport system ATP-binding protein
MPVVSASGLRKWFGGVVAVDGVSFTAADREITTLLGPSGCGKTTTLRCVAGLEKPDGGEIRIGDRVVNARGVFVPPEKRGVGMVFQSYAIWPHMTVFENVAYGLKIKGLPKQEVRERVKRVLSLVRLEGLEDRLAPKLSGGQQQRVALARSLVMEPEVLLLDEPLSNLDFKLREAMRVELKEIQRRIGITTIYVTHDQTEALALSDTIIVMHGGKIMQIGTPKEIYRTPRNKIVADFIGQANFFEGRLIAKTEDQLGVIETDEGITLTTPTPPHTKEGERITISIRPEHIKLHTTKPTTTQNTIQGRIIREVYQGNITYYKIDIKGKEITAQAEPDQTTPQNTTIYITINPKHITPLF